jgi:hypothetical protein
VVEHLLCKWQSPEFKRQSHQRKEGGKREDRTGKEKKKERKKTGLKA